MLDESKNAVTLEATTGEMSIVNVAYTKDGSLTTQTFVVNGVNDFAIRGVVSEFIRRTLKAEMPFVISDSMRIPGISAFITPKSVPCQKDESA